VRWPSELDMHSQVTEVVELCVWKHCEWMIDKYAQYLSVHGHSRIHVSMCSRQLVGNTHTHTHTQRERERESIDMGMHTTAHSTHKEEKGILTHTGRYVQYTHTHTHSHAHGITTACL